MSKCNDKSLKYWKMHNSVEEIQLSLRRIIENKESLRRRRFTENRVTEKNHLGQLDSGGNNSDELISRPLGVCGFPVAAGQQSCYGDEVIGWSWAYWGYVCCWGCCCWGSCCIMEVQMKNKREPEAMLAWYTGEENIRCFCDGFTQCHKALVRALCDVVRAWCW